LGSNLGAHLIHHDPVLGREGVDCGPRFGRKGLHVLGSWAVNSCDHNNMWATYRRAPHGALGKQTRGRATSSADKLAMFIEEAGLDHAQDKK
jgi:hypothetical protein